MISTKYLRKMQAALTVFLSGTIIAGFCAWYRYGDDLRWVDSFIYDLHFKWRGSIKSTGHVVLVLMDQKSAEKLERTRGNWSRYQLAEALENLCRAGAEIIGLDMVLQSPDADPDADAKLAEVIDNCGNVVLAWGAATHGGELLPIDLFLDVSISDGFIDFHEDNDDILRRIRFLSAEPLGDGGVELFPAFSLELARTFLNIDYEFDFNRETDLVMGVKGGKQVTLPNPDLLINYPGDFQVYKTFPYSDAVLNRFDPDTVKGKIVIIGSSMATSKDFFGTPFTRFRKPDKSIQAKFDDVGKDLIRKDPGVACHAHAVDSFLRGKFIKKVSTWYVMALAVGIGVLGLLFYWSKIGGLLEILILLAGTGTVIGTAHWLFVREMLWLDIAPVCGVFFSQFIAGVSLQKIMDRRRTALVTDMFGKYVAPSVVAELIREGVNLENRNQELTVLFTDLRGFTTVSEHLGPKDTGILLNTYFNAMIPIVFDYQGTLDKLMGDAVMAFFGAPLRLPEHPEKAAETALAMLEALENLKKREKLPGIEKLQAGIGINTGSVTIGNLGSDKFRDYTVIGDTVNLGSRLEGLTKEYGVDIIVSEFTAAKLGDRFLLRELDMVRVKGKEDAVTLFELVGYFEHAGKTRIEQIQMFHSALKAYKNKDWDLAFSRFENILKQNPNDGPSRFYLDKISGLRLARPDETWDGITNFDRK